MAKAPDRYLLTDPWTLVEEGFHPEKSRVSESLFSLANEYQGVRGYFEEGYSGDTLPGCYVNQVFEEHRPAEPLPYKGISRRVCFMVNTVDWLHVRLEVDGELLDLNCSSFSGFRRALDMRTGRLERTLVWHTRCGKDVDLAFSRLLSMEMPEIGFQRIAITPVNFSGAIGVTLGADFSLPHESYGSCLWECARRNIAEDRCAIMGRSRNLGKLLFAGFTCADAAGAHPVEEPLFAGRRFQLELVQGRRRVVDRQSVLYRADDPEQREQETWAQGQSLLARARLRGFEDVLHHNTDHWSRVWADSDIEIKGDPDAQQGIRFCLFQLHQTCRGETPGAGIGAKGLTGEAYNGNSFWDTEVCCLPHYLFTNPRAARSLIEFRHRTLEQAKERARELDCAGACFPVATIDGTESCTLWQHASLQLQATTAVAYAIMHYCRVTGDRELLFREGAEILVEICRFLASRGQWTPRGFGYYAVMGPDEFHMMVNNNCYTNFMAQQAFRFTLQVLEEMDARGAGAGSAACNAEERRAWTRMAEAMIIPRDPRSGVFEQHDGYFDLPHIDIDSIGVREFPLYANWSYDRIFRTDMIKQPDVLMFLFLHARFFTGQEKRANYEYYTPRCIHESSLSPSVHSILAAELGRDRDAFDLFRFATRIDLDNYNRNTSEGLHMTSIAAAWMNIVYGFGGLRSDGEELSLDPRIPPEWEGCSFQILWRGSRVRVEMVRGAASVRVVDGPPVRIVIGGEARQVAGSTVVFATTAAARGPAAASARGAAT